MSGYDTRRLLDNVMAVSIMGALVGYLGRLTFDWLGVLVALLVVAGALLWAERDARSEP